MKDKSKEKKFHWKDWLGEGHFTKRLTVTILFFVALAAFLHFREVRMEVVEQGTISDRYIIAHVNFSFPDEEAALVIKQQSVRDIGAIYRISEKQLRQIRFDFESYLLTRSDWRDKLKQSTFDELYKGADALEEVLGKARFTNSRSLQKMKDYGVPTDDYYLYTPENLQEPAPLPKAFWNRMREKAFVAKNFTPETTNFVLDAFEKQTWTLQQDGTAERNLRHVIQEKVPDQYTQVTAGDHIIDPGEKVTARHLAMLQSMKEAIAKQRDPFSLRTIVGSLLLSLLFTTLSIIYFKINHPKILNSVQKMTLLVTIVILTLIFSKLAEYILVNKAIYLIDIFRYPIIVPFASILILVLVSSEVALFGSAFLSIVIGVSLAIDHDRFLILNLIASWVTILFAHNMHKRKEVFSVLAKVWLVCVPVIIAFNLSQNVFIAQHLLEDLISSLTFAAVIALLVIGLLPLLESIFHVMTDMTLMEYMDPNNELLRRLSVEAPGTYQHCLVVGNLAESAARAIGAGGLFCRVATLYHDIGKLFNPHYFTENQLGGFNIHQLLTPLESTQVIIAHVPEGEALARKHRLPQSFIDIIREHHGTTLVYYFYHKQLEQAGEDEKVDEKLFRYPGPKPHTKESAIIMLADTVEAASRSLDEITEEALTKMVDKLVKEKSDDNQLDECQLTFEELGLVKKTLVKTLSITGHLRVKYPEKKKPKEEPL
ncbi:MAG: HDIG domain-containing protein [Simkaniaceae bacterium]|nr:HDIG domain-containing protein [Candidatus Sacchlamyda saccharinae]